MNRFVAIALTLIAGFLLQVGVAPYITIGGVAPNFFLIIVTVVALVNGSDEGVVVGFIAGIILDLLGTGPVGPWAMVLALTGYVTGLIDRHLFAEGWLLPVSVLSIASLFSELLYMVVLTIMGSTGAFWSALLTKVLPTTVYTIVIAILAFPLLSKLLREDTTINAFKRIG